jgi:Nif-specific regulatory protein
VVDSAVVLADGDQIEGDDLALNVRGVSAITSLKISDWEQKLIRDALKRTGGKVPEAAMLLGIGRATLYRKLDDYDIDRDAK